MSNAAGSDKEVWLTEFNSTSGSSTWSTIPTMAINGVNHGLGFLALWNVADLSYCGGASCSSTAQPTTEGGTLDGGKWGLWAYKDSNYAPKTVYYLYSDITAHTAGNSLVYANSCDTQNCGSLRIAALNDQLGHDTVLVQNQDTANAQPIQISYSGASPNGTLYRYLINPASSPTPGTGGNVQGYDETITMSNGSFSDTIPPGSFAVYSSLNPVAPSSTFAGDLTLNHTYSSSSN